MKEGDLHWCQTANFQCFFIKRNAAVNVHFENEKWLEDTGYALPDDQVFFYKLYLNGGKILFAPEIRYTHLDAKSGNIKSDKLYKDYYTAQRNYTIFWCRFLYAKAKTNNEKLLLSLCLLYRMFVQTMFFFAKCIIKGRFEFIPKWYKGYKDAFIFNKTYT